MVLDSSIVGCWCFPDENSPIADAAFDQLGTDQAIVPVLWWFEVRNVLVVNERRGRIDAAASAAFLADLGLKQSGLDRIIRAAYDLLGYISFFTVGEDECRAWSIPRVTPAVMAAGAIHSDIQRGFIRAEVVAYDRLVARGSLAACRDHGELRLEGKDYPVADGDVITFRHAT